MSVFLNCEASAFSNATFCIAADRNGLRARAFGKRWHRSGYNCAPGIVLTLLMDVIFFWNLMFAPWMLLPQVSQSPTNLAEDFITSHCLWSVPCIRRGRDAPIFQKQHWTVLFPFPLTSQQLCAATFPYGLFSCHVGWKGVFRTLQKCPVYLHLPTECLSKLRISWERSLFHPCYCVMTVKLKVSGEMFASAFYCRKHPS